jgi:hypothetical protein
MEQLTLRRAQTARFVSRLGHRLWLPPNGNASSAVYTTKKQGLGLGLSICRSIITAHLGPVVGENSAAGGRSNRRLEVTDGTCVRS